MQKVLTSITTVLCLLIAVPAFAHPHAWIDVAVKVLTDDKGRVTGLRQSWYFDEGYSAFTLEGLRQQFGEEVPAEALNGLAAENLSNLADYSWFTKLEAKGVSQDFVAPTTFAQVYADSRLLMQFDLMLATPLAAPDISWQIYDPGYYIEMLYLAAPEALQLPPELACSVIVQEPEPSEEMVIQAAMLDKSQKAEDGLGALFAQKAILTCP